VKQTAGLLIYRSVDTELQVLLIHPSGNYNRHSPWGIPKGLIDPGEELEQTARRETWEETGVSVTGDIYPLGYVDYKHKQKRIFCFTSEAPADCAPHCASWEVDRAEFVSIDEARKLIHPDQALFIDRLMDMLREQK